MGLDYLIRSLLIFPGHVYKYFLSAVDSDADAIVIDLEDAVPSNNKKEARDSVVGKLNTVNTKKQIFIRVNGIDSGLMEDDIEATMHEKLTGYVLPMVKNESDIQYIDEVVSKIEMDKGLQQGAVRFFPLIEQAESVLNSLSIAQASKRNVGLIFGHEDFLLNMNAPQTSDRMNLLIARSTIAMAARAIGGIPIDAPFLNISDMKVFSEHNLISKSLGFSGVLAIHKSQAAPANTDYMPSTYEVTEAEHIIRQVELSAKEGRSISFVNGRFAGPPIVKSAKQLLDTYNYFVNKDSD